MSKESSRTATPEAVVATLSIVVAFTELPDSDELDRILDECKAYGRVTTARLEIHRAIVKDLA